MSCTRIQHLCAVVSEPSLEFEIVQARVAAGCAIIEIGVAILDEQGIPASPKRCHPDVEMNATGHVIQRLRQCAYRCGIGAWTINPYKSLFTFDLLKQFKFLRQRVVERILSDKDEVWFGSQCRAIFHDDEDDVKEMRRGTAQDSKIGNLAAIQQEMEDVSASMTMMGQPSSPSAMGRTLSGPMAVGPSLSEEEVIKMGRAFRRLDALYKASKLIGGDAQLQTRMEDLLDLALEVMNAERGFLMLKDEKTDKLGAQVARGMENEFGEASPSMGIARRAAYDGEPVLMSDSGADDQFAMRESIIRQRIVSACCVPLQIDGRILGALYVDSSKLGSQFTDEDLELFQSFANQSAMAIENVRLYERMLEAEKKRANLGRFLSPAVVEVIMNDDTQLELGGETRVVTTLFCDIRSFTPMAEGMRPTDLIELLNEHFTAMTEIVFQHDGTLDKYNGDEVMALFGAPMSGESDAQHAVQAAVKMQAKNAELNAGRKSRGTETFEMGIGINTGEVSAGFVGSPDRMDFTVLGAHVNVAARLCSEAKGGQVLAGESTYDAVKDIVEARSIGTPDLKGIAISVNAYEILSLKP